MRVLKATFNGNIKLQNLILPHNLLKQFDLLNFTNENFIHLNLIKVAIYIKNIYESGFTGCKSLKK
jgi:hypothetical protein